MSSLDHSETGQYMIARLFVLLPFSLTVPEGEQFPVYEYEDDGYRIRVYPPGRVAETTVTPLVPPPTAIS